MSILMLMIIKIFNNIKKPTEVGFCVYQTQRLIQNLPSNDEVVVIYWHRCQALVWWHVYIKTRKSAIGRSYDLVRYSG